MTLRWTDTAFAHLESIHSYIAEHNPKAANAAIQRILKAAEQLASFPKLGKKGQLPGSRVLVIQPFTIVYQENGDVINITAVFRDNLPPS